MVEDDPVLGRGLSVNLDLEGFKVNWVRDLKSAFQAAKPDLVLLDLGLPDGNGLKFLRSLRQSDPQVPVVILTARTDENSVVEGLQAGANDYVRKPFGHRELFARIKTALRVPQAQGPCTRYADLRVQFSERKVYYGANQIDLNRREFDILSYFVQRAETVVSRESLIGSIDKNGEIFDRTIDSHVSHLRSRLRLAGVTSVRIASVYGVGYRLEKT